MFNCNPPIALCYPLLWGGGILVDHWSTISSCYRHEYTFGHVWGCGFAGANALEMTKILGWALDKYLFSLRDITQVWLRYFWEVLMIVIQSHQGMIQGHIVAEKLTLYRNHHSYADYFLYFLCYLFWYCFINEPSISTRFDGMESV